LQKLKAAESAALQIEQMTERLDVDHTLNVNVHIAIYSLQHNEQKTAHLEQEIIRLQQLLHARSQENNNLCFQIESVAKSFHLSPDQIQLMIQQALNQQQLQSVLYQCDNLREQLREKNMTISDMQHQLVQFEKLRENNFTSDEVSTML